MTRNLLRLIAQPAGPATPETTYRAFIDKLRPFSVESLVAGFNEFAWKGWKGEFPQAADNALAVATAPGLATYSLAVGSLEAEAPRANYGNIIDLHLHYLAIESVPSALLDQQAYAIAKAAIGTSLALVIPTLQAARLAATNCIIASVHRAQLLPSRGSLDELSKTWWIAKRVDADADQIRRAEHILGMQVPIFVRAATALLAFAVESKPAGCVSLEREIDREFLEKYDVDKEVLKLAAYKLATTRADVKRWMTEVEVRLPEGARQFVPTPLLTTPLLELEIPDAPQYVCPSLYHFISAARDRVREAISVPGSTDVDSANLYGEHLVRYVEAAAHAAGESVIDLDTIERRTLRRADLLFFRDERGLIVEVKRSLAPGALSKHLLYPEGIVALLKHLLGAFEQCLATYERRAWASQGLALTRIAAVILVDEPVGAEGGIFADLLGAQTQIALPFEVMSVIEFENAIGVLGTAGVTDLVRKKWTDGLRDVPLAVYAKKVLGLETIKVAGKRRHLEVEDRELFFEIGMASNEFAAEWP